MATTGETAVVLLKSPKDWTRWLALIKTKAVNNDLWQHIDPSIASPPSFTPPVKPLPTQYASPSDETATTASLTAAQFQRYNAEILVWQEELKDHRKKVKVITEIEDHVIRTAGTYWSTIESVTGLHARLTKLKERVAPSTYAREQEVTRRYEQVRTQAKSTRTEEWLAEWESALRDAIELKLPDVQDTRPTRHFLQAVETIDPLFAQTWFNTIEANAVMSPEIQLKTVTPDGFQIAQIFRNQQSLKSSAAKGAFAASTLQGEQAPSSPRPTKCPIHQHHNIDKCYTLNKAKRPEDWTWSKKAASNAIKAIEKDSKSQEKYKDILTEAKKFLEKSETASQPSTTAKTTTQPNQKVIGSAFAQPPRVSFASTPYALKDSFILDSGSPSHICNSKDRFESNSFKQLNVPEPVLTGDDMSYITGYGDVVIRICTPTGEALFLLKEVAYISGFHTNVVAHKRLRKAGYSWDDINNNILRDGQIAFYLKERDEQYVIEYNPPKAAFSASTTPRPPRDADANRWHLRYGHIGQDALERLMSETYGVRIKGQLTISCEACAQATAKRKISRRAANKIASRPLWRIHFDLFQLTRSSVGFERALVIRDEYSGRIWTYSLPDKTQEEVTSTLEDFANMAKRQWSLEICVIRRDNEKALGKKYAAWIKKEGIKEEPSPVYTPEPNGRAERSGGVLRAKALSMQLSAKLPAELWPETWQAAAYLYNRSPREANLWKSPLETFRKWLRNNGRDVPELHDKPDPSNLYTYGCRAYPLKESILKDVDRVSRRTSPRAHLGYLVGYEGGNIYRIWVPSKATVIRTRDVDFNEDEFFNPDTEKRLEDPLKAFQLEEPGPEPIQEDIDSDTESTIYVATPNDDDDDQEAHQDRPEESAKADAPADSSTESGAYPTPNSSRDSSPQGDGEASPSHHDDVDPPPSPAEPQAESQRPRRNRQLTDRAQKNLDQTGNPFRAGFAVTPVTLASFHTGTQHRLHRRNLPPEPRSWKELQGHTFKAEFIEATKKEWDNLSAMRTVQIVKRNDAKSKPLPLTWVFKYKYDKHGFLTKFKARICVRGDLQPPSEKDTYAATLAAKSFRILMALAARWDLQLKQLDAVNAFPNSPLDEEVYIELPDGFKQPGMIGRLLRALYGLRRSPLLWQRLLSTTLTDLGLKCALEEPCLFVNDWLIVFFFVDDIVYMYRDSDQDRATKFCQQLTGKFKMRDLGDLRWFLGIRIARDRERRRIWLSQDSYIENVAARFNLDQFHGSPSTPMISEPLLPNEGVADQASIHLYQRKVGSIIYNAVISRPDVARAAAALSSFLANPSSAHMAAANRCIQYLYGTRQLGILYDGELSDDSELAVYTDASFADNLPDRKSSQGYLITLFGGPIAWKSGKQDTITTSSTEAELLALTAVAKEAVATLRLFAGMRFELAETLNIWCDNRQTIRLVNSELPRLRTALRHVDIHHNWARQEVQNKTFTVNYLQTDEMPADGLTKALPRSKFKLFVEQLGLTEVPRPPEDEEEEESPLF
jgi:Reverse transcriptase (RNA-dependent DNA polymerase)